MGELVPVGFWRGDGEGGDLPDPRALVDPAWSLVERARVAAYLREGDVEVAYLGHSTCQFRCGSPASGMGSRDLTDGRWVWPESFAHYVELHGVRPPEPFLAEIRPLLPATAGSLVRFAAHVAAGRWRIARARVEAWWDSFKGPVSTPLSRAVDRGDVGAVAGAFAVGFGDANEVTRDGTPVLHRAVRAGHLEVVRLLLARGAKVDRRDVHGATALVDARRPDVAEALLDAGASVDAAPPAYLTALGDAVSMADTDRVAVLLARGADPNRADRFGRVPLALCPTAEVADLLVAAGADPRRGNPLLGAARLGDLPLVDGLIARGAPVDVADAEGRTAVYSAASGLTGLEVVARLLAAGARPDVATRQGDTALLQACAWNHGALVKRLIAAGASVARVGPQGATALHLAAVGAYNREDTAALLATLLAAGALGLDARDAAGRTPLRIVAELGDAPSVSVLLAAGADRRLADRQGVTPLDAARARRAADVVALLMS